MRADSPRLRIGVLGIVAVSLFTALFARLWYLQVLASPDYQVQATANQQRVIIEPAPRGRILDRNGAVLVDNRLSYVVSVDRRVLGELDAGEQGQLLGRVTTELQAVDPAITVEAIQGRLASNRFSPYTPVPLLEDAPESLAVYLTEHRADFDNAVVVELRAIRTYPFGRLAAHVLGYVGSINDDEFASRRDSPLQYQLTDDIGKAGVERTFEEELRGQPGRRVLEVDANGNTIRELEYDAPVAGHDVVLSIDYRIQAVAETALREELERTRGRRVSSGNPSNTAPAGSTVVLDPNDGSVVAMASYPDFNPADFTDGIDQGEWEALNADASYHPLINRAIEGQYAPGSTFKLITAFAGLSTGFITPSTTWADAGSYRIPNCRGDSCVFRNAGSRSYGRVDLRRAITVSSDAYFYDIGARLWFGRDQHPNAIQDAAHLFGMGADSGVPLPNEKGGRIMTPEEFAARHEEHPEAFPDGDWQAGDNVNMAIGQGEVLVTPIQLANAYATLANGGTLHAPNIALRVLRSGTQDVVRTFEPRVVRTVDIPPDWRAALIDGFTGVVSSPNGTAHSTFSGFPESWPVAGKTGTAEVSRRADTAVFVGMGPMPAAQYVAATFMEESGFGGVAGAPLVRRIFEPIATGALPDVLRCTPSSGTVDPGCPPEAAPFGYSLSIPLDESADPLAEGDVID